MTKFHATFDKNLLTQWFEGNQVAPNKPEFRRQCELLRENIDRVALSESIIKSLVERLPQTFEIPLKIPKVNNSTSRAPFLDYLKNITQNAMQWNFDKVPNIDMTRLSTHLEKLIMKKINERIKSRSSQHVVITQDEISDIFRLYYASGCSIPVQQKTTGKPEIKTKPKTKEIKDIPESNKVSVVHHVKELILSGQKFEVHQFSGNADILRIIKEVTGKTAGPISGAELRKIISAYPEKIMEVRLKKMGQWEAFKNQFPDYKQRFQSMWNQEAIARSFQQKGKNAMTIAGVTYGLTTIFGLGGENSKFLHELTNLNAWKESGKKPWKLWLSAGLGAQIGGIPIAETTALAARFGMNTLGRVSYTGASLFANMFNGIEALKTVITGGEVTEQKMAQELAAMLPTLRDFFKGSDKVLLEKFYLEQTGEILSLKKPEIDRIAYLTVATSSALIDNNDTNLNTSKPWKLAQLQSAVDISALALSRHPNPQYREDFQKAVNKYIAQQRAKKLKPLFSLNAKGIEIGEITKILNNESFDNKFEKGARKVLAMMSTDEQKSIIQMLSSNGLSGMLVMAFIFIQGSLSAIQGIMYLGGKAFGEKSEKEKPDEEGDAATNANKTLTKDPEKVDKNEWKRFVTNLKTTELINNKKDFKTLKKLPPKKYKLLLKELNDIKFSATTARNLPEFSKMQRLLKTGVKSILEKELKMKPLGEVDKQRKKQISDVYFLKLYMEKKLTEKKDYWTYDGFWGGIKNMVKSPAVFLHNTSKSVLNRAKVFANLRITNTGYAKKILSNAGVPSSQLKLLAKTNKINKERVRQIIKVADDTLKIYAQNPKGEIILDELSSTSK